MNGIDMKKKQETATAEEGTASRILTVATKMLMEEGCAGLSMRKISSRLGLSQAALYRHYRNKAELVQTIIAAGYAGMLDRVLSAARGENDPRIMLKKSIEAYISYALEKPEFFKSVLLAPPGPGSEDVNVLSAGVARKRRSFGFLAECLAKGMDAGLFARADIELTAQAVWAAMFGLTARLVLEGKRSAGIGSRIVEREIEISLRGLSA